MWEKLSCVGEKKWCFISPISSHLTITTWLHAKFGTFTLRIEEKHDEETL